jgi:hypothetical protein
MPSMTPSVAPSITPSAIPTPTPTIQSTFQPSFAPTRAPTSPTFNPTRTPTAITSLPSTLPTFSPSHAPSLSPTTIPTAAPSFAPTPVPLTAAPTLSGYFVTSLPTAYYAGVTSDITGQYLNAAQFQLLNYSHSGQVYYSHDHGQSWSRASNLPTKSSVGSTGVTYYDIVSSLSGQYVAVTMGDVYYSTNYGVSYSTLNSPKFGGALTMDSTGSRVAVIDTVGKLPCMALTTNGGQTWSNNLGPSLSSTTCKAVAMDSTGKYIVLQLYAVGLYTSSDGGLTWSATYSSPNMLVDYLTFGHGVFYSGIGLSSSASVIASYTNGSTWVATSGPGDFIQGISASRSSGRSIAVGAGNTLYLSTNTGQSYTEYDVSASLVACNGNGDQLIWVSGQSYQVYVGSSDALPPVDNSLSAGVIILIIIIVVVICGSCCAIGIGIFFCCKGILSICCPFLFPREKQSPMTGQQLGATTISIANPVVEAHRTRPGDTNSIDSKIVL